MHGTIDTKTKPNRQTSPDVRFRADGNKPKPGIRPHDRKPRRELPSRAVLPADAEEDYVFHQWWLDIQRYVKLACRINDNWHIEHGRYLSESQLRAELVAKRPDMVNTKLEKLRLPQLPAKCVRYIAKWLVEKYYIPFASAQTDLRPAKAVKPSDVPLYFERVRLAGDACFVVTFGRRLKIPDDEDVSFKDRIYGKHIRSLTLHYDEAERSWSAVVCYRSPRKTDPVPQGEDDAEQRKRAAAAALLNRIVDTDTGARTMSAAAMAAKLGLPSATALSRIVSPLLKARRIKFGCRTLQGYKLDDVHAALQAYAPEARERAEAEAAAAAYRNSQPAKPFRSRRASRRIDADLPGYSDGLKTTIQADVAAHKRPT